MADNTRRRPIDGALPGYTGPGSETFSVTPSDAQATPDTVAFFDPPLRILECTGTGTVTFIVMGDDETDAAKKRTKTLTAGTALRDYAIKKIFATGTTATGIWGAR